MCIRTEKVHAWRGERFFSKGQYLRIKNLALLPLPEELFAMARKRSYVVSMSFPLYSCFLKLFKVYFFTLLLFIQIQKDETIPNIRRRVRKYASERIDKLITEIGKPINHSHKQYNRVTGKLHPFEHVILLLTEKER